MKKEILSISSIAAAIVAYVGIMSSGVLNPLNGYLILGETLPRFIYASLFMLGVVIVILNTILTKKSLQDGITDLTAFGKAVSGYSDAQLGEFAKETGKNAYKEAKNEIKHTMKIGVGYPSPETLLRQVRNQFHVFATEVLTESSIDADDELVIVPARADTAVDLETEINYNKRSLKILFLIIMIAIVVNLIVKYVPMNNPAY